jgi:hypothetical protein
MERNQIILKLVVCILTMRLDDKHADKKCGRCKKGNDMKYTKSVIVAAT